VLALSPAPGSWLAEGDPVDLQVASGSNSVPATANLAQAEAVAALQNAGFTAAVVVRAEAAAVPGTVLASQPADATVLRLGTTVTLTVAGAVVVPSTSSPPETPTPTTTPVGSAPPAP
jgi:serine/threonine-protein kinase